MSWLVPFNELTPDQQRAVEMDCSEHRAIVGGPGSGKTQILLHRARHLCERLNTDPSRFRILVYTNVLKDYIRTALRELILPEENVLTFDHWVRLYYQEHISKRMPWDDQEKRPAFDAMRRAVMAHCAPRGKQFDFVLIDEAQDLNESVITFLRQICGHITLCLDNKQQIYEQGASETAILRALGINRRNINLIEAFRVCPYLVELAAALIASESDREAFRNQTRQPQVERQTPVIYFANNFEDEKQMLYQMVRERQLKNDRIAILLPQNRQVFGFAKGLTDIGVEVETPKSKGQNQPFPIHDFASSRPKLMSYHSAKGLTFDSVFLPRLVDGSFQRMDADILPRLLFVAVTRATRWCYMSTNKGNPMELIQEKLVPLADKKTLTLLDATSTGQPAAAQTERSTDDLSFL